MGGFHGCSRRVGYVMVMVVVVVVIVGEVVVMVMVVFVRDVRGYGFWL